MDEVADAQATGVDDYVRVFDRDPELLAGLDGPTRDFLQRHGTVPCVRLEPGTWHPPMHRASARGWLGLDVLDGFLVRRVVIGERRVDEVLGPGDLLRPWDHESWDGLARAEAPHIVLTPVTLALLDGRFAGAAGRVPRVVAALMRRSHRRASQLAAAVALAELEDPAVRLGHLLRFLAERFGEPVAGGATALPAGLTDTALALLLRADVAATREALAVLAADAAVVRDGDGRLVVTG